MRIAITGTIASGKTSVSILLKRRGFAVFNSDQFAKTATHASNPCFNALIEILGEDVKDRTGDIDRRKMAEIIFSSEEKRKQVNAVVHPYVKAGMEKFLKNHDQDSIVFAEVPLLFEAHLEDAFDEILVVTCKKETAIKRMMEDRDYTEAEAEARYASQLDPGVQIERATQVIYNDSDLKELDHEINLLVGKLRRKMRNGN